MLPKKVVRFLMSKLRYLFVVIFTISTSSILAAEESSQRDFSEVGREAARILADLIRIDTTNPPGNETQLVRYVEKILKREKIEVTRLARYKGRDNLIARIAGNGKAKPLLLYNHSDVVPADMGWGEWVYPPYDGIVENGVIYGRGAIDAKGLMACHLATMLLIQRSGITLDRDLIFLVAAGEETGGGAGVSWLLDKHPDQIEAEFALGEGGRVWEKDDSVWTVWIQAGEKSAHNLTVSAKGVAGHASVPSRENAISKLTNALNRLEAYQFSEKRTSLTDEFARLMSPFIPDLETNYPRYYAMTHNTISVTAISGGIKSNVIPPEATANLNLRILPGEDLDEVTALLNRVADQDDLTINHKKNARVRSGLVPHDTDFFRSIASSAKEIWPDAVVTPYLSPGTSDASKLREHGILTYGLMPFPLTAEEGSSVHGANERVRLDALEMGCRFMYEIVVNWSKVKE